jgi:large subunit ribosomal protein L22
MVTIQQKFIHMAPRKLRLVADLVRGKNADAAYASLAVLPKAAAKPVQHAIKSAVSAAKQSNSEETNLIISAIFVDEGPALKRRIFRAKGRATAMEHRMSHLTVSVAPAVPVEKPVRRGKKSQANGTGEEK